MNIVNYKPSPQLKNLCLDLLQFLDDNNIADLCLVQDILSKDVPLPILYYTFDLLYRNDVIEHNTTKYCKPKLPKHKWNYAINNLSVSDIAIRHFEENVKHTPYIMPNSNKIIFKELTEEEYLEKSEFYDYEFASLFVSTKTYNDWCLDYDYLHRAFAYNKLKELKNKKKSHIIIAECDNHVLGYISISNYVRGYDMFFEHSLPCQHEDIFYVNYIQTRKEAQRKHIALGLLGYALNEVFYKDNAYAVNYEAICDESELLLNKTCEPIRLDVYKRKYADFHEYKKYGSLRGHIITKQEQNNNEINFEVL